MSLSVAVNTKNTFTLLIFMDITSHMNKSREICLFFPKSGERRNILMSTNQSFFVLGLCNGLSPPFIFSTGITGSSVQFLLMLFCCHGHQVLQYAPWHCLCGIVPCTLIDITDAATSLKLHLMIRIQTEFTKENPTEH